MTEKAPVSVEILSHPGSCSGSGGHNNIHEKLQTLPAPLICSVKEATETSKQLPTVFKQNSFYNTLLWTCATWSWMPPSAIMRSVCNAIWRASSPSEVEQFKDQYVMRNIRFTMEDRDRQRGRVRTCRTELGEINIQGLPGVGNLGESLKPPYSSS